MGSGGPQHLLQVLCILSVLAGRLPPTTAQWFYPLGLEDTTPDPSTSPTAPTASTLDEEEGRHGRMTARIPWHPRLLHLSKEEERRCGGPGSRAAGGTAAAVASAGNWDRCATPVPLQSCHLPPHCPFALADGDARSMEPTQKVLLSKPPLAMTPRRREPLARGTAKGPGHAPLRTRGQVPFPGSIPPRCSPSPPKTPQPLPGPSPRPSPYLCPARTAAPARAGQRALLHSPATAQLPLPPWRGAVAAPGIHPHGTAPWQSWGSAPTLGCGRVPRAPQDPPSPTMSSLRPS